METQFDSTRNPDSFLQIGDMVAASFFIASISLLIISLFLFLRASQMRSTIQTDWKELLIIVGIIPFIASLNSFYRRNYWIETMTDPVEFRFFDWFLTVPLMVIVFYYLLKPLGVRKRMLLSLVVGSIIMLGSGYIGEALYPESPITWGILGTLGLCIIVGSIMSIGYPKILKRGVDPALKNGYLALSLLLPLGWSVYPFGYMSSPGNILEGFMELDSISLMYNLADVFNKGGLALGVYLIARNYKGPIEIEKEDDHDIYRENDIIPDTELFRPVRQQRFRHIS